MSAEPSLSDLQRLVRDTFGRELDPSQLELVRYRVPTMARLARVLEAQAAGLGEVEPAGVYATPPRSQGVNG
jgi:hypothetical protein